MALWFVIQAKVFPLFFLCNQIKYSLILKPGKREKKSGKLFGHLPTLRQTFFKNSKFQSFPLYRKLNFPIQIAAFPRLMY